MQTAVQLYSFRDLDWDLHRLLDRVADTGVDAVEFAGFPDTTVGAVADTMDRLGLAAAGLHTPYEQIEDDFGECVSAAELVDADAVVVPYLDETHFESESAVSRTARHLSDLAVVLEGHDVDLWYHNHEHEFVDVPGTDRTAFECLADWALDVQLELDVGWAVAAGEDPVALLEEYGDQIPAVHLKDVLVDSAAERGGRPVELGSGDVPVEKCARAARQADVDWLIYEHDAPSDPLASLEHAGSVLSTVN
ncbi:sugar phosphate isomerase/epimerase family protein [Salinirubrum litoreum]|uniref:Sugar phosphate isomerase/epimerase family protein n=1 Tax=Salinirubrum litoreum TaxID=1126234 RepID=A0ABD5RE61_9EURY|nr:sugar phosphate isomerase/epimerase [Salinirubrum litoreum]